MFLNKTFKCFLGSFKDDSTYSTLRTVFSKIRPVEIIYDKILIDKQLEMLFKNIPNSPLVYAIPPDKVKTIQMC